MKSEFDESNLNDMTNMFDAESDPFDLFEAADDAVNDDINDEENLIEGDPKECKIKTTLPVPVAESGIKEIPSLNAEVVEDVTPVVIKTTGTTVPQIWMPYLPFTLSAQTLFNLALNVDALDPVRQMLGFYYEYRLQYECNLLIPHPIHSYYRWGILNALMIRRNNPGFFMCNAIDVVLTYYFNNFYPEDNDVFS